MLPILFSAISRTKNLIGDENSFHLKRSIFYLVTLIAFMLFGTLIFSGIEGNAKLMNNYEYHDHRMRLEQRIEDILLYRDDTRYTNSSHLNLDLLKSDIQIEITKLRNLSKIICHIQNEKVWSFHDSLSFSKSVITTIGYGVYYPTTTLSKIVCIVYAIIGVPLFLHFLGYITYGLQCMNDSIMSSKLLQKQDVTNIVVVVVAGIVLLSMIINGTITHVFQQASAEANLGHLREETKAIFNSTIKLGSESDWSYFVCIYYVFTTITSIGFGDLFVHDAGQGVSFLKDLFTLCFLSLLIAMFAFLFGLIQENIENYAIKKVTKKVGATTFSSTVQTIIDRERALKRRQTEASLPTISKLVLHSNPIKANQSNIVIEKSPTPVKLEDSAVKLEDSAVKLEDSAVKLEKSPTPVKSESTIEDSAVKPENSALEDSALEDSAQLYSQAVNTAEGDSVV